MVAELDCRSFGEFYFKILNEPSTKYRDRIIDAMATNETYWFRDESAWTFIHEVVAPDIVKKAAEGQVTKIWCAAASTGQEPYSLVIAILEAARMQGVKIDPKMVSVLATDISSAALFLAIGGRYDVFSMERGMPVMLRDRYFKPNNQVWTLNDEVKIFVTFKRFNRQSNVAALGDCWDIVLLRNVLIYFSDTFKREILTKICQTMTPGGTLLLGAAETLRGHHEGFDMKRYKDCSYSILNGDK